MHRFWSSGRVCIVTNPGGCWAAQGALCTTGGVRKALIVTVSVADSGHAHRAHPQWRLVEHPLRAVRRQGRCDETARWQDRPHRHRRHPDARGRRPGWKSDRDGRRDRGRGAPIRGGFSDDLAWIAAIFRQPERGRTPHRARHDAFESATRDFPAARRSAAESALRSRTSAARDRIDRGRAARASAPRPGGVLRYGVSSRHAASRDDRADSAALRGEGRTTLWLSRTFLHLPDGGTRASGRFRRRSAGG